VDHQAFDGAAQGLAGRLGRQGQVRLGRGSLGLLAHLAPAQEVDAAVVGDAEQPGGKRTAVVKLVELAVGLEHGLLHHILAVHGRAGHARAVAVQLRPQMGDGFQEGGVARVEQAGGVQLVRGIHGGFGCGVHAGYTVPGRERIRPVLPCTRPARFRRSFPRRHSCVPAGCNGPRLSPR